MSLKTCSFDMDVPRGVSLQRPIAEGAAAVFERLLEVFAPRVLWIQFDGHGPVELSRTDDGDTEQARWLGEEIRAGNVLTRCPLGPAADLVRELRGRLAAGNYASLFVSANGALRHRAPGTAEADWYGHWQLETGALLDLVEIRLQWTEDMHGFELELPHSGYPLTTLQLRGDGSVGPGDPDAARGNRTTIMPVLAAIPGCLGLASDQVRWSNGGDYAPLFPDDAAELRGVWLPRLRAV
jgi:hypothetical protein